MVVQQFCDSLYGHDNVWSAKHVYFTRAQQLSVIMMSTKRQLVVKLMEDEENLLLASYLWLPIMKQTRCKMEKRFVWMRDWLQFRVLYGQYEQPVAILGEKDAKDYTNYMRISPELFQELSNVRVPAQEKGHLYEESLTALASSCHSMDTGDSYKSLSYSFRLAHNTIIEVVPARPVRQSLMSTC